MTGDLPLDKNPTTSVEIELDGAMWGIHIEWGAFNGRIDPARLSISCPEGTALPVTASRIRRMPLGSVIAELRRQGVPAAYASDVLEHLDELIDDLQNTLENHENRGEAYDPWTRHRIEDAERRQALATKLREVALGPQRGRRRSQSDLEAVAAVYKDAFALGRPVQAAVAEHFHLSVSAAAKRIMAARQAGLLDGIGGR
jgi:hypothetical protein